MLNASTAAVSASRSSLLTADNANRLSELLLHDSTFDHALERIAVEIRELSGFPLIKIQLYDSTRSTLLDKGGWRVPASAAGIRELPADTAPSAEAIRNGQPLARFGEAAGGVWDDQAAETLICAPIQSETRLLGVLNLGSPDAIPVDEAAFARARSFGRLVAVAIERRQEVTDLNPGAERVLENDNRMRAIVDNVLDGIVTTNEDGVIEAINPAGARIFGCEAADVVGRKLGDLMTGVKRQGDLLEMLVAEAHEHQREFIGRRLDGTTFPMYMAVNIVALGDRWLYTAIIQDLTESRRLETERMEKERLVLALEKEKEMRELKGRFVSTLSHELRTPLAAILLANNMLSKFGDRASPEERQEYLTTISEEVEHLSQMISDILSLSRTEATGLAYNPEPRSIEMLCLEVLSEVQKATRSRHKILFSGPQKPVEAMVDDKLLRHAISNLLTNAIKYSPEGGDVRLELARKRGQVKISVSDHGIGIPEEDLPHLFEPFQRAGNTERISGTGLGLYIVHQAVELHGGTIAVDSKLGVGTTFTITLPVKAPAAATVEIAL